MIGRDFNQVKDKNNITTLSVIIDAYNVVFGLYTADKQLVCHSTFINGLSTINDKINILIEEYAELKDIMYMSKSDAFAFQNHQENQSELLEDRFTLEQIFCYYEESSAFPKLKHFSTALHHYHLFGTDKLLHFHLDKYRMHCFAMNDGKFIFYNSYDYATIEDFLYYSILVGDQLDIRNHEQSRIYLSGNIVEDSIMYDGLQPYFNNISFLNPKYIMAQFGFNHYYLDHHLNLLCG